MPSRLPISRIQDVLENLGGHKYFSTLDMSKAYHQGFMHENSQHVTSFTSPWGLYEWLRIPFGLPTAPPAFQRSINQCLSGLRDSICIAYLNDILCYGKTFDEHLENFRTAFRRLRQFRVKNVSRKMYFVSTRNKISRKNYQRKRV